MTTIDMKAEIARIAYWKQVAAEHDVLGAFPWHLPRIAATQEQINLAESRAGAQLSVQFKEFLGYANGWKGFCVSTDLFGTEELISGKSQEFLQREDLVDFLREIQVNASEVVVIGASGLDLDVFLLFPDSSHFLPGGVLWFASEEIDRYESFGDFLAAMVNYNARNAQRLAAKQK